MSAYISEFDYFGVDADEFIEVALPEGANPADYSVIIYDASGTPIYTLPLGTAVSNTNGFDVYLIDDSNPAFDSGGDPTGLMYPDDALALVGPGDTVLQFISYEGNTVTAGSGPANGMTSTNVGSLSGNGSLQSDDGGSTYYAQSSPNEGTIPACFAKGTMIRCPGGEKAVETLRPGDRVETLHHGPQPLRWLWQDDQDFLSGATPRRPVLLRAGAFGGSRPHSDLVLSAQHRVLVGTCGQIDHLAQPALCKALHLTDRPRIRTMQGKRQVTWYHLLLDRHEVIWANGLLTESLYLGPMILAAMTPGRKRRVCRALGIKPKGGGLTGYPRVLPFIGRQQLQACVNVP